MWSALTKPVTYQKQSRLASQGRVDEKREPLKSKTNEDANSKNATGKKQLHERESVSEKLGTVCSKTATEPTLQRVVPVSEWLVEELSQALVRMDMRLEVDYAYDILSSLMRKQPRYTFRGSDMPQSVLADMRAPVVDWLVQVHEYLALASDTLFLAVYLMNAYLQGGKVQVATLQLLGITCLFVACKVEESTLPAPAQLCAMTNNSFSRKQLLRMERKILARLNFELHYTNPVPLLRLLAEVHHCSMEAQHLARYFMELSLTDEDCMCLEPALLSFAALGLAQQVLHVEALPEASPKLHMYSESELSAGHCLMANAALRAASSPLQAVFLKYARPQKLCISTHPAVSASGFLRRFLRSSTP